MSQGTKVRAWELDFPSEAEEKHIKDDYCLVTDGRMYLDKVVKYGNGTVVLTLKVREEEGSE